MFYIFFFEEETRNISSEQQKRVDFYQSPVWQSISSLRSLQSGFLSHWRVPWIQAPSLHWNQPG